MIRWKLVRFLPALLPFFFLEVLAALVKTKARETGKWNSRSQLPHDRCRDSNNCSTMQNAIHYQYLSIQQDPFSPQRTSITHGRSVIYCFTSSSRSPCSCRCTSYYAVKRVIPFISAKNTLEVPSIYLSREWQNPWHAASPAHSSFSQEHFRGYGTQ